MTDDGSSAAIFDRTVNGKEVCWKVSITDPMPMTLEFAGTVNGDETSGTVACCTSDRSSDNDNGTFLSLLILAEGACRRLPFKALKAVSCCGRNR